MVIYYLTKSDLGRKDYLSVRICIDHLRGIPRLALNKVLGYRYYLTDDFHDAVNMVR